MSKELIVVNDSRTLFDILQIPQTEEEKKIETELCIAFRNLLAGEEVASDIEGYEQLLSYFERGGL